MPIITEKSIWGDIKQQNTVHVPAFVFVVVVVAIGFVVDVVVVVVVVGNEGVVVGNTEVS